MSKLKIGNQICTYICHDNWFINKHNIESFEVAYNIYVDIIFMFPPLRYKSNLKVIASSANVLGREGYHGLVIVMPLCPWVLLVFAIQCAACVHILNPSPKVTALIWPLWFTFTFKLYINVD